MHRSEILALVNEAKKTRKGNNVRTLNGAWTLAKSSSVDVREESEWGRGTCREPCTSERGIIERDIEHVSGHQYQADSLLRRRLPVRALRGQLQKMGYSNVESMDGEEGLARSRPSDAKD